MNLKFNMPDKIQKSKTLPFLFNLCLYSFLLIISSCNGQKKTNTENAHVPSTSGPVVIRSFNSVGVAPDFDTNLVSQYIRSIFQDSKGNLWFGTLGEGVVRYDGKTLTYFSNQDGFYNNTVYAINEDATGNIWLGTDLGVYKYDGKSFRNYTLKDGLMHLSIGRRSILVDSKGIIWVGTNGGVYQYNANADSQGMPCFALVPSFPKINVADIFEDSKGNIWVASLSNGIYCYDGKSIINFNEKEELGVNYAGGIAQDKSGNMWFTMKNGICKYDGKTFTEYTPDDGLGGEEFWGIYIEKSGAIWITARGSTTRFDPSEAESNDDAFKIYTAANGFTCCVQSMYQDKSGNMWWGTGQGLYRFDGNNFYQVKKQGPW